MKGKGYRSSVCQGGLDRDRASGSSGSSESVQLCFVMIYQTGIRLDDRGKSYTESEAFEKQRQQPEDQIFWTVWQRRRT